MEQLYKNVTLSGAAGLVIGIVSIAAGVTVGVISIVNGALLLRSRKNILF